MGMLDGKVAVITGAGSGMAKASVKLFVSEGARVVAGDMSGAEADTAAAAGNGGAIVNWSSVGGLGGSSICPGFIHTEIMGAHPEYTPGILEKAALNRGGQAHEVAEVAAFLASDRASFVSGAIIPVDGGWSAKIT